MAAGAISVVTPIAAVAAGIPVIWGVAVSGDHISFLQAIGFVGGDRRQCRAPRSSYGPKRTQIAAGVGWAVLAMLAFGAYYVPMHAASTQDWLWPAFLFRCTSVTLVWSVVLVRRARPDRPSRTLAGAHRDRLPRHGRERALRRRLVVARADQRRLGAGVALSGGDGAACAAAARRARAADAGAGVAVTLVGVVLITAGG